NISAGIYTGITAGMDVGESVSTYTTLTVGDGLVNQIPAILVAICAGMVVTRIAAYEGSSLGSDVQAQLLVNSGPISFTGFLLLLFSLVPDVPTFPFLSIGAIMLAAGLWQM